MFCRYELDPPRQCDQECTHVNKEDVRCQSHFPIPLNYQLWYCHIVCHHWCWHLLHHSPSHAWKIWPEYFRALVTSA